MTKKSLEPLLEDFLQPVTVRGGAAPRKKHREINDRIAVKSETQSRRRLARASKGKKSQSPLIDQPFDDAGYRSFWRHWREEIETLEPQEQERVEARAKPYFQGLDMGAEWFQLLGALRAIRSARTRCTAHHAPDQWTLDRLRASPPCGGW